MPIDDVLLDKCASLLPEYYLRTGHHIEEMRIYEYKQFQAMDVPVSELFEISGGNSGLTEEYLYSLLFHEGDRRYRLLTGSANLNSTVMIHRCQDPKNSDRKIRVVSGEGIHIVRKGKAGHINYLSQGDYTMTDDAYVLTKKKKEVYQVSLESVRRLYVGLQSFRSMSRMDASLMKASALRLRFSQSLASRRQRLSQAMVRSTTQRLGWTTKPFTRSDRLTISVSRSGRMPARAR